MLFHGLLYSFILSYLIYEFFLGVIKQTDMNDNQKYMSGNYQMMVCSAER
jgi:hypothetical protein